MFYYSFLPLYVETYQVETRDSKLSHRHGFRLVLLLTLLKFSNS